MYTTSLKTWARAVGIDSILIGALVAGVIFHTPYALEVSVFFLWWLSILIVHIMNDVQSLDVSFCQPIHHFIKLIPYIIKIKIITFYFWHYRCYLFFGQFIYTTINCV